MMPPKSYALPFLLLTHLLLFTHWAGAQTGAIRGKVVSADGKPAELVNVGLKGTATGTVTDSYGNFSLANLSPGSYTVQASFIGFAPQEQPVEVLPGETVTLQLTLQETARQLDEIVVKGYVNYKNDVSNLATRTATPLLEVPQSIQVVPQQVLKDQQVFTLNEGVKNFAGIAQFSVYQDYTMRGFRANDGNFAYNGVRGALYQFDLPGQLYNVEKIEAIKGPASSLFSNATPGGIINVVTKQPQLAPKYELQATYGTYGQFRLSGDATGPLSRNKKLLYRLVAGYENAGSRQRSPADAPLFPGSPPCATSFRTVPRPASNSTCTMTAGRWATNGASWRRKTRTAVINSMPCPSAGPVTTATTSAKPGAFLRNSGFPTGSTTRSPCTPCCVRYTPTRNSRT
jgi:iron complex outermembrane receptor protein